MTAATHGAVKSPAPRAQPWFAPRIWLGATLSPWLRLLAANQFQIAPSKLHIALSMVFYGCVNSLLAATQQLRYGRAIEGTQLTAPPLFILGHWRTGTTLLHELLILDSRHGFPTTFECLSPNHFLLSEGIFTRWLHFLVPSQRPMDNMALSFDRPQEEEFAFCNLGMHTPYRTIAFPNRPPQDEEYLDLRDVSPADRQRWQQDFEWFLKTVTFRQGKRLVLKSPPHTARVKLLLEMFPDAHFVHITRDPLVVFPSTVHLWRSLYELHGLQVPNHQGLEEYVFRTQQRMYRAYEADRGLIPPGHLHELRYEELVQDPVGQLQLLYEQLSLGAFESVRPAVVEYLDRNKNYQTNKYILDPQLAQRISREWGDYQQRYGYARQSARVATS